MTLKQVSSTELNQRPGAILRQAQAEPVAITSRGESVVVMLPLHQYQAMGGERLRFLGQSEQNQGQAKTHGLAAEMPQPLLADVGKQESQGAKIARVLGESDFLGNGAGDELREYVRNFRDGFELRNPLDIDPAA